MADIALHYKALNLDPDATPGQVKQAYRELAKQWHPDKVARNPEAYRIASEKLKEINAAYEFLRAFQFKSFSFDPPSSHPVRADRDSAGKREPEAEALEVRIRGIERLYLESVEKRRRIRNGLCPACGRSLTAVDRLLGRTLHRGCRG